MPKGQTATSSRRREKPFSVGARPARSVHSSKPILHRRTGGEKEPDYPVVVHHGGTTHVLVPVEEYERLIVAEMALESVAILDNAKDEDWIDADDAAIEFARDAIVEARKKAGLTQKQLGEKLGLPQSQISRIERRPDRTTVRTLRRLARALKVDVSVFLRGL